NGMPVKFGGKHLPSPAKTTTRMAKRPPHLLFADSRPMGASCKRRLSPEVRSRRRKCPSTRHHRYDVADPRGSVLRRVINVVFVFFCGQIPRPIPTRSANSSRSYAAQTRSLHGGQTATTHARWIRSSLRRQSDFVRRLDRSRP